MPAAGTKDNPKSDVFILYLYMLVAAVWWDAKNKKLLFTILLNILLSCMEFVWILINNTYTII